MTEAIELTGELHDWYFQDFGDGVQVVHGRVYNDAKGRFWDGQWIRTSYVIDRRDDFVATRNSVYLLVGEELKIPSDEQPDA